MGEAPTVPGVVGVHHVAFAVPDLDAALEHWTTVLGAHLELRAVVAHQGVEAASLEWPGSPTLLELVAPLDETSGVARFIAKRGAGMHHVAWAVEDVAGSLHVLARSGARLIDAEPRVGLHGTPVAFVHPASMGGVLVELVQVA
ncbi:MAG: methylmalonyl-CoA epimerase [Thermoleophilia bacterium]|nr:methylmalonyl-CoA epimerase [Thermoleophilia bacterium]